MLVRVWLEASNNLAIFSANSGRWLLLGSPVFGVRARLVLSVVLRQNMTSNTLSSLRPPAARAGDAQARRGVRP